MAKPNENHTKGLGLCEADIKALFGYFDVDGSGEIDFSEFRCFLQGGAVQTGLAVCDCGAPAPLLSAFDAAKAVPDSCNFSSLQCSFFIGVGGHFGNV